MMKRFLNSISKQALYMRITSKHFFSIKGKGAQLYIESVSRLYNDRHYRGGRFYKEREGTQTPPWHRETKVAKGAPRMIPLLSQYYSKTTATMTGGTSNNGVGTDTKLY